MNVDSYFHEDVELLYSAFEVQFHHRHIEDESGLSTESSRSGNEVSRLETIPSIPC